MARRVYFAFDYKDVFQVNQIRKAGEFVEVARSGFHDASQWEKLKQRDDSVIRKAIDDALVNTSVTVVCVGERTANRRWVKYEITASRRRGNGLLAVYLPGTSGHPAPAGLTVKRWDGTKFGGWVEAAARAAGR